MMASYFLVLIAVWIWSDCLAGSYAPSTSSTS